jgi:hypothetical protein
MKSGSKHWPHLIGFIWEDCIFHPTKSVTKEWVFWQRAIGQNYKFWQLEIVQLLWMDWNKSYTLDGRVNWKYILLWNMYYLILSAVCVISKYLALKYSANSILQEISTHMKINLGTPLGGCELRGVTHII